MRVLPEGRRRKDWPRKGQKLCLPLFCAGLWPQVSNLGKWPRSFDFFLWDQGRPADRSFDTKAEFPFIHRERKPCPWERGVSKGFEKRGNLPSCFSQLLSDFPFHLWTRLRNSDISLMKMSNASRQGQEKSEKKKRKSRSVRVKVKMKRTRSFTTPKTCPWAGMAK